MKKRESVQIATSLNCRQLILIVCDVHAINVIVQLFSKNRTNALIVWSIKKTGKRKKSYRERELKLRKSERNNLHKIRKNCKKISQTFWMPGKKLKRQNFTRLRTMWPMSIPQWFRTL